MYINGEDDSHLVLSGHPAGQEDTVFFCYAPMQQLMSRKTLK